MTGSNRLAALAADIQAAHHDVTQGALAVAERAVAAGRMLEEAKAGLPHGRWASWLAGAIGMSARTARRYMQIARSGMETATVADLGIRGATAHLARATHRPVSDLDSDPEFAAWRDELLGELDAAPSRAARDQAIQVLREQVQVERFAALLRDRMAPSELDILCGWLAKADLEQVRALLAARARESAP